MMKRLAVVALLVVLGILAQATTAYAETYDITKTPNVLSGANSLGSVGGVSGQTAAYDGTGPCTSEAHPDGYSHAAVYKIAATVKRYLELSVSDDASASPSLCQVALYAAKKGDVTLTDPFDATQRQATMVISDQQCAATNACTLHAWLADAETYYLVFWSDQLPTADPPPPTDADFKYNARVRRMAGIGLKVSGERITDCKSVHEFISGKSFTATAATTATGSVKFLLYRAGKHWSQVKTAFQAILTGRSKWQFKLSQAGSYRLYVRPTGSDTDLPGPTSGYVSMRFVTPRWRHYSGGGVKLTVPFYKQQLQLSCEAATLRIAHNYFQPGDISRDMEVYRKTGIDHRYPNRNGGCDPDRAFCGNVNGQMMADGYGVHYGPIAKAATLFTGGCRPAIPLAGHSFSKAAIARYLDQGFPVIVWGAHKGSSGIYRFTWRAWNGHHVEAYSVEHVWTVVGYRGRLSSPKSFIVHDPSIANGASFATVSASSFHAFTKYFNTGVVVRG